MALKQQLKRNEKKRKDSILKANLKKINKTKQRIQNLTKKAKENKNSKLPIEMKRDEFKKWTDFNFLILLKQREQNKRKKSETKWKQIKTT